VMLVSGLAFGESVPAAAAGGGGSGGGGGGGGGGVPMGGHALAAGTSTVLYCIVLYSIV
jgi:hypothetical protein